MNDNDLADHLAATIMAECDAEAQAQPQAQRAPRGPFASRLADAFKYLRGAGIPWLKILAYAGQIMQILATSGGDWQAVLRKVLELFNPPATQQA